MSAHNFQPLYERYPEIIAQMPGEFTSHEFILRLAQQNQADYIEALYSYRDNEPFRKVHGQLANQLHQHQNLVTQIDDAPNSPNIFGEPQICSKWRKAA